MIFYIVVFILVCIILCLLKRYCFTQNKTKQTFDTEIDKNINVIAIPKDIILTIRDKSKIPSYIYEQYNQYAKSYNLKIFDDNDCIEFLQREYGNDYVNKFNNIKLGAHKADFFRYAYLYKYGGIYLDVKTLLLKNIDEIFEQKNEIFYMIYTFTDYPNNRPMIYNGIIATYPKNPYIQKLLEQAYQRTDLSNYHSNLIDATTILKNDLIDENIHMGINKLKNNYDVRIFKEDIRPRNECTRLDRWGFCTFVKNEKDEKIFRVRDPNYTTNYN
tara:strand:+ start:267 stop:1085 length:819 start_codon:yes stop_codon:yes gene_type:complete